MSRSGLSISIAFRNSGCSIARKGRFEDIKKIISCSLQATWLNAGMTFELEAYPYYQFVHSVTRVIHLLWFWLQIVTIVLDRFLSRHISYAQHDAEE